jgi:hypothetical protein
VSNNLNYYIEYLDINTLSYTQPMYIRSTAVMSDRITDARMFDTELQAIAYRLVLYRNDMVERCRCTIKSISDVELVALHL